MIRIFKVFVPTSVIALLLIEAVLIFGCYLLAAYLLMGQIDTELFLFDDHGLLRIALGVGVLMFGLYFLDMYAELRIRSRILLVQQLCLGLGIGFVSQALLGYGVKGWIIPHWVMILGSGLVLALLPPWRIVYTNIALRARLQKLIFLGASPVVQEIAAHLAERPELGMVVLGYLNDNPDANEPVAGLTCLGGLADLNRVITSPRPDRIVVGMTERRQRLPVTELLELRFAGIHIEDASAMYEAAFGRICTREFRPSQLIFSTELGPRPDSVRRQSLYAPILGMLAALIALPVMLLVALLVRLSSRGPILLRQQRVGAHDMPFTVYKFRSMCEDAEAETGAVWARKDDPRITWIGRYLRRYRLDELPQFINVIRGEMSIVGPRPERPEFVKMLSERIPYYRQRHCVKPGITGWAQINYKYGDTIEDTIVKLEYDLYYIKHISFSLDLYVIFHTLKTMLVSRGAQ
jgi:sugar transferase (PEP-CTERM system associated)